MGSGYGVVLFNLIRVWFQCLHNFSRCKLTNPPISLDEIRYYSAVNKFLHLSISGKHSTLHFSIFCAYSVFSVYIQFSEKFSYELCNYPVATF
jgi:hypothetical protein